MSFLDFLRPIPTWTAGEVRNFLNKKTPDEYNLIDVRQPHEYEKGHIPGAKLIPVGELGLRINDINRSKPTILY